MSAAATETEDSALAALHTSMAALGFRLERHRVVRHGGAQALGLMGCDPLSIDVLSIVSLSADLSGGTGLKCQTSVQEEETVHLLVFQHGGP